MGTFCGLGQTQRKRSSVQRVPQALLWVKYMTQNTGNNGDDDENQHYLRNVRKIVIVRSLQIPLFPESVNRLLDCARQVLNYARQCVFHSDRYITCIRCKSPYRLPNFVITFTEFNAHRKAGFTL
jgi:hypothetical protein